MVNNTILLNASDYIYYNGASIGGQSQITATIRDIGTGEALYFAFIIWMAAVVFHEFGHWLYMLTKNPNAKMIITRAGRGLKLQTGEETDYNNLTTEEKNVLYLTGIATGFIPIFIAGIIHPLYWLVIPAYIVGTYRDMELIVRNFWSLQNNNNVK